MIMRRTQCRELIFFSLAILLLLISGSGSSDQQMGGPSDQQMGGSSDEQMGGSSDQQMGGSSDQQMGGSSDQQMGGSSDQQMGGSSDQQMGGSSDQQMGGSSDQQMGGSSDQQMGGSPEQQMSGTESHSAGASSDAIPIDSLDITNVGGEETAGVTVQNWRGLAIKGDESYPIRLNVETIRTLDPVEARRLLALNISPEEVRSRAKAGGRDAILGGSIRLNNDSYRLMDMTLESSGNRSTLRASVADTQGQIKLKRCSFYRGEYSCDHIGDRWCRAG